MKGAWKRKAEKKTAGNKGTGDSYAARLAPRIKKGDMPDSADPLHEGVGVDGFEPPTLCL